MERSKALSTWIQAVQVWKQARMRDGKKAIIPKKGTPEHAEIIAIMNDINSGKLKVDPTKIKTMSKPTVPKVRSSKTKEIVTDTPKPVQPVEAVPLPKLSPKPSTARVGKPTARAKQVKKERSVVATKQLETDLKEAEKKKDKIEDRFERRTEKINDKIVKLITKFESGKSSESDQKKFASELKELQTDLALVNETEVQETKRVEQEAKIIQLKHEAEQEQALADEQITAVVFNTQNPLLPGLTNKLNKHQAAAVAKTLLAADSGKIPNFGKTKGVEHLRTIANAKGTIPVRNKEIADKLNANLAVPGLFSYESSPGKIMISGLDGEFAKVNAGETIPGHIVDVPQPFTQPFTPTSPPSLQAEQAIQAAQKLVDESSTFIDPEKPVVSIEEVAPIISELVSSDKPVKIDAEQIADIFSSFNPDPNPFAEGAGYKGHRKNMPGISLIQPESGLLIPGSRNSGPVLLGRGFPGSRNSGIVGIGGSANTINPNQHETNPEALRLAAEMKLEIARINELSRNGVQLLVGKPGQSIH